MAKMATNKNTNTIEANALANKIKELYNQYDAVTAAITITADRRAILQQIHAGNTIDIQLRYNDNTELLDAILSDKTIGTVMDEDASTFYSLHRAEPNTNIFMGAKEVHEYIGDQPVNAQIFAAASVATCKIHVDLNSLSIEQAVKKKKAEIQIPEEEEIDLSYFSAENAAAIKERFSYVDTLTFDKNPSISRQRAHKIKLALVKWFKEEGYPEGCPKVHTVIKPFNYLNPTFINNNGIVENTLCSTLSGCNIAFVGDQGTGKQKAVQHFADFFNLPKVEIIMSNDIDKDDLLGNRTFLENGKIGTELSTYSSAVLDGCLVNLDEAAAALPQVLMNIHGYLDGRRCSTVNGYGTVTAHPRTLFFISYNEGFEYKGNREFNSAFIDRFHKIYFKPDRNLLPQLLKSAGGCEGLTEKEIKTFDNYYKMMYDAVYSTTNENVVPSKFFSRRKFIEAARAVSNGFISAEEAFNMFVLESINDEYYRKIIEQYASIG